MMSSEKKLRVNNITKSFKGVQALKNVSFEIKEGEIVGLIGPNGAGKTSLFNVISGMIQPDSGTVSFNGQCLTGYRPDRISQFGVGRTFQIVKPFKGLTVEDNVIIGALAHGVPEEEARRSVADILDRLFLKQKQFAMADQLTLPERKRLEVARALSTKPRLLLLDEVMAGLRPGETDMMVEVFLNLNKDLGMTILLIEHVMRAVMRLSHHIVVLNYGEKIAEGEPETVTNDPAVLQCYLGHAPELEAKGSLHVEN